MRNRQQLPEGIEMRQIPGFLDHSISECGKWIVSAEGNVITQSLQLIKGKESGYLYSTLCSSQYRYYKRISVHRLVAYAWLPQPPTHKHVWINHKDGNKANNNAYNLEWTTISQNIQHKFDTGLHVMPKGSKHWLYGKSPSVTTRSKMSAKKVGANHPKFTGYYYAKFRRYESILAASKDLGIDTRTLKRRCNDPKQRLNGYYFIPKTIDTP